MTVYQPDWKCPDLYPMPGCDDFKRLAWEFIRRNKEYAAIYSAIVKLSAGEYENGIPKVSTSCLDGFQVKLQAIPGEQARDYYLRLKSEQKKVTLIRPYRQFTSIWPLTVPIHPDANYDEEKVKFQEHIVWIKKSKETGPQTFQISLFEDEIALRFRLGLSWDKQFDDAKRRFIAAQEEYSAKSRKNVVDGNKTKLDMVHYWLRSYDAYQQRALLNGRGAQLDGPTQIIKVFKKEHASKSYEHEARLVNAGPQSVVDWHKKAREFIEQHKFWLCLNRDVKPVLPDPSMVVPRQ